MSRQPFVPVGYQYFTCQQDWVNNARPALTGHPDYRNTEHPPGEGWRGHHFTALCFDQKGRRCRIGSDFQRAEDEDAYPVWWVWPDQIASLLMAANSVRPDEEPALAGDEAVQQAAPGA